MTDIARLSITVDSKSARTAAADLQKLGAVSEAVAVKIKNLAKGIAAVLDIGSVAGAIKDVAVLAVNYETYGQPLIIATTSNSHKKGDATTIPAHSHRNPNLIIERTGMSMSTILTGCISAFLVSVPAT